MKKLLFLLLTALAAISSRAQTTNIGPWTPLFRGVELSLASVTSGLDRRINCLRIDLTDPEVRLFSTPACTNGCVAGTGDEVSAQNTSLFVEQYGVQVAVNGMFFTDAIGPGDVPVGTLIGVFGLSISGGKVISPEDDSAHSATMHFASNNVPTFIPRNWPPADSNGVFTAITGNILLLTNGMNAGTNVNDQDPRTALGISQDRRYFYMMTVDGRQNGWSTGVNFYELADWLARFGAYEGMAIDGGGSTTMAMADCQGKAVRLNRPSYVSQYGRERVIGQNIGVYARPLPTEIKNLAVQPGTTTAILTWRTDFPSTTQVEYGLTTTYGNVTPLDSRLVREHAVTVNGLAAGTTYQFRAISMDGSIGHTQACSLATTSSVVRALVFGLTNAWKFSTNNNDTIPSWKTRLFDDSTWAGPSNGCLHTENPTLPGSWPPRTTILPPGFGFTVIPRTYSFRTHFNYAGGTAGVSLTFSNYIDDGAVFYLNGGEIGRVRMPVAPAAITNATIATSSPCQGAQPPNQPNDAYAACPDVFTIAGNLVATNLLQGDNVVAVEVHNVASGGDIFFGSALFANQPSLVVPRLLISSENGLSLLSWNGTGFTLQRSSNLSSPANWSDVPGPVTQSSALVTNTPTTFYRLRN